MKLALLQKKVKCLSPLVLLAGILVVSGCAIHEQQQITLATNDTTLLNEGGLALADQGKYEEAIPYFDKVLEIEPNDVTALNNKGAALSNIGKPEEAIPYFDRVLEIEPNDVDALNNKGVTLFNVGKYDEALPYFDKVLATEPNNAIALKHKGLVLNKLGESEEAIQHRDTALELEPIVISDIPIGNAYRYDFAPELIPLLGPGGCTDPSICSFYLGAGVGFYPLGLTLGIDGVLHGTPTATGNSEFQICVKDVGGKSACRTYTLNVKPASETVPQDAALLGEWEGMYTLHKAYSDGCDTADTTAKISICMTPQMIQPGQESIGDRNIDFPEGFRDTEPRTDPDVVCMKEVHCGAEEVSHGTSGGIDCGEIFGHTDSSGKFTLDVLQLDDIPYAGYTPAAYSGAVHTQSITISGNSMTVVVSFDYGEEGDIGSFTSSGSFTATKVSDSCNT